MRLSFCSSHLKDLAVLRSCQDPVGSPADATNRQTWRRKKRRRRKRIRSAVKISGETTELQLKATVINRPKDKRQIKGGREGKGR